MSESFDPMDNSPMFQSADEHAGAYNFLAQYSAIQQRKILIEKQSQHTQALEQQTQVLEQQTQALKEQSRIKQESCRIEQDRVALEKQRLQIEKQRLQAEESEREHRRLQAEQVKQIRLLMADCLDSIERLNKLKPAS